MDKFAIELNQTNLFTLTQHKSRKTALNLTIYIELV